MNVRIKSTDKIDLYAFYLSEAATDYIEGDHIDIDPLYIPDIIKKFPWVMEDFRNGKINVFVREEEKDIEQPISYGINSIPEIFDGDKLLNRFSIPDIDSGLETLRQKAIDSGVFKPWQIKECGLDDKNIYSCLALLKFVGKLTIDNELFSRGHLFKKLSSSGEEEIENP